MADDEPKLTFLGKLMIFLFIAACAYGAYMMFAKKPLLPRPKTTAAKGTVTPLPNDSGVAVEIGIAYGTEKQRWLQWAVGEFAKTAEGSRVKVNLIPMGSLEGAQAVLSGDKRIHAWSPASSLYKNVFVQEWSMRNNAQPIIREDELALSPMVFVIWAQRYDAFIAKYGVLNFQSVATALREPGGWDAIAQKPEWGVFKFGHTHPNQSNSGLMTLVLMAYDYHKKTRSLGLKDILDPKFQAWMNGTESAVTGLSNSTGNMMRDMVLRGPSSYDALFVYENVVIDYLKNAEGRWGELRVAYPRENIWNNNPYYILDVPWSDARQRAAAAEFLRFLMSEPMQRRALEHGFRPGNPEVSLRFAESPLIRHARQGIRIELPRMCEPPRAEVVENLLAAYSHLE